MCHLTCSQIYSNILLPKLSCVTCSLDDFEVCSNGAAETSAHTAAPVAMQPLQASQSEADTSPNEVPSDNDEAADVHEDSCSTDDDEFSDVGEAPDTEVIIAGTAIRT